MKAFKSIAMVKCPRELAWVTIRDRLPELAPLLDDMEKITSTERQVTADGTVRLVNIWKAAPQIPAALASMIKPEMLAWTDRAEWRPANYECHWRIEPHFFPDRTRCTGVTRYEPAMGGRGTRITFEGQLDVTTRNLAGVPSFLEATIAKGVESFVTTLIPKNFRKLTQALETFLGEQTS